MHLGDTLGTLDGDGGDRRLGIHAERLGRLEIGLDAGATAGIRPGDDQQTWRF
jgi:hypothetical protein